MARSLIYVLNSPINTKLLIVSKAPQLTAVGAQKALITVIVVDGNMSKGDGIMITHR